MSFETELTSFAKQAFPSDPGRVKALCQSVFHTPEGQELLAILCTIRSPVDHTFCPDARLSEHLEGNKEVIATLWRYGSSINSVPEPTPTQTPNGKTIHKKGNSA